MIRVIPEWVTKAENRIRELVDDIIREQDIDWHLSHDSKSLDDTIESIPIILEQISEYEHPMHPKNIKPLIYKKTVGRPTKITLELGEYILNKPIVPSRLMSDMIKKKFGVAISYNTVVNFRKRQRRRKHEND